MFYTIVKVIIENEKKELVNESGVKKTTKKKLKIKLNKKSKNKTDNNISLDINEFVTDESLTEVTKNNIEQAQKRMIFKMSLKVIQNIISIMFHLLYYSHLIMEFQQILM